MVKELRELVLRGNLVELAVAVVIGTAFGAVVNALVKDLFTPIIAAIGGEPDFGRLKFEINGSQFLYTTSGENRSAPAPKFPLPTARTARATPEPSPTTSPAKYRWDQKRTFNRTKRTTVPITDTATDPHTPRPPEKKNIVLSSR